MKTVLALCFIVVLILSRDYPMYKQCDYPWGSHSIGISSLTICQSGSMLCSAAMALTGTGHIYDPLTLNTWLINNDGYISPGILRWESLTKLGLKWRGQVSNLHIKQNLDIGNVVIINVSYGYNWVLASHYSGDTIYAYDPRQSRYFYKLSQIVDGNSLVYTPVQKSQIDKKNVKSVQEVEHDVEITMPKFLSTDEQVLTAKIKTA